MAKDIENMKDKNTKRELEENRYPPIEVAEAKIKQALLRYEVAVQRVTPMSEREKVC